MRCKDEVKNELVRSLVEDDILKNDKINKRTDNLKSYQEAMPIVREYEAIIKKQKKNILNDAYRQGCILKKFKESILRLILLKLWMNIRS